MRWWLQYAAARHKRLGQPVKIPSLIGSVHVPHWPVQPPVISIDRSSPAPIARLAGGGGGTCHVEVGAGRTRIVADLDVGGSSVVVDRSEGVSRSYSARRWDETEGGIRVSRLTPVTKAGNDAPPTDEL